MITAAKGSLTMLGLNTPTPQVFWNGITLSNITHIKVDWEDDEQRVKLKVTEIDPLTLAEMTAAGIIVKVGAK